jgi:hypothetical protein
MQPLTSVSIHSGGCLRSRGMISPKSAKHKSMSQLCKYKLRKLEKLALLQLPISSH